MSLADLGLVLAYWLHMLATVVWIGGLAAISLIVLPAARRSLSSDKMAALMAAIQKRLSPLAWFSLAVLVGTGLFQMSASPNYDGFLAIENTWAAAILVKHLVFLVMILLAAYQTWGVMPALQRAMLRQARQPDQATSTEAVVGVTRLQRREDLLTAFNLALGVIVLLLTAVARSA
jgi:uncharacterized membrane protein